MHTADGTIYRSRDRGQNWKRLRNLMLKEGLQVADNNQVVSCILSCGADPLLRLYRLSCVFVLSDWRGAQDDSEPSR